MTTAEKLEAALKFLGKKWVLHPKNPNRPTKGVYNNFGQKVK